MEAFLEASMGVIYISDIGEPFLQREHSIVWRRTAIGSYV
jgi:hypothetical protein